MPKRSKKRAMQSPPSRSQASSRPAISNVSDSAAPDATSPPNSPRMDLASGNNRSTQSQPAVDSVSMEIGSVWYLIAKLYQNPPRSVAPSVRLQALQPLVPAPLSGPARANNPSTILSVSPNQPSNVNISGGSFTDVQGDMHVFNIHYPKTGTHLKTCITAPQSNRICSRSRF